MAEQDTEQPQESERAELTLDELIRSQLQGKTRSLGQYDAILWKLRSGYVVVLYGVLTDYLGKRR